MSWTSEFTNDAERDFKSLPKNVQRQITRVLATMETDPFQGDVKPLHGPEWRGVFRRRVGSYRLLFTVNHASKLLVVVRILLRSEGTYR